MPVLNHVHCYIKYKGKLGLFRCNSPDCTHFTEKEAILGKLSLCTECGTAFILSRDDLRRARPKCLSCSNTKKGKAFRKAQELTKHLGTDSFTSIFTRSEEEPDFSLESKEEKKDE